jgi:predicted CXXCH cytochrome family protein
MTLVIVLMLSMSAFAQYSHIVDIIGTDHNLSSTGPGTIKAVSNTQICYYCHVPHQMLATNDPAVTQQPNAQTPLWNHYLSSKASYGVYSSPSFDALGTDIQDLGGAVAGSAPISNLCLSCHDGTVGVNTLYKGQYTGTAPNNHDSPDFGAGLNVPVYMMDDTTIPTTSLGLREDHPINFTYDATLAAKSASLVIPITNPTGLGGTGMGVLSSGGHWLPLYANKLQCASCHDVHSNRNGRPFLRASTAQSELCLACHGK